MTASTARRRAHRLRPGWTRRGPAGPGLWEHPVSGLLGGFAVMIVIGTVLLLLPVSTSGPAGAGLSTAFFTSVSASCAAGMTVVDTGEYWSGFGQSVILVLVEIGGLGLMISAALLGLVAATRLGLHTRLTQLSGTRTVDLTTIRRVVRGSALIALAVQGGVLVVLTLRLWIGDGYGFGKALYYGLFHAISAFTDAGFALWPDNLARFAGDPVVLVPIALAVLTGGLGYPVLLEGLRVRPIRRWSVHTRLTLLVTVVLLIAGPLVITVGEWRNPGTLGGLHPGSRLLSGIFDGVVPRTSAFHTFDYGHADASTQLFTDLLMVIGGASASTAGGIKVTTIGVLVLAVLAEIRGQADINAFDRRMAAGTIRQAVAVCALAAAVIIGVTLALLEMTGESLDRVLFDVTSAFGTVGLSTGVTAALPDAGRYLMAALIVVGRVGPISVATALALRPTRRTYRHPEARPILG